MSRAANVHALDWGMLFCEYSDVGISCLFISRLGVSLLFPVRRQNMCLVGTLTIRGLLSSLVPSSVFIVL